MPKVYSYIRFSSKAQATGDSLRRQTAQTERWAASHGHELDEALTFRDLGVSAYDRSNLRSGALGLFLKAAQQGKIERGSILAIEALDRLTRAEPLDAFRLLSDIVSCGVSIVTVSDERVYDETSLNGDFASLMLAAALLVRGHEESKRKSERLKEHYSARRTSKAGRINHAGPIWLRAEGDGWGAIPEQAQTVLEIYQLAAEGQGSNAIARRFNEQKRPHLFARHKPEASWHPGTVAKLLRNRAVIGECQPRTISKEGKREEAGDPIPGHYPIVVPEELFWRVQSLVSERDRRGVGNRRDLGYSNILSGILTCGYCGSSMFLEKKGRNSDNSPRVSQFYYGCSKSARHASGCNNRMNYKALLFGAEPRPTGRYPRPQRFGLLPALFGHLIMHGEQLSASAEQHQEAARQRHDALTGQRVHVEARKATLIDSLEAGVLTRAEVQPRLDRIRGEIAVLQVQLESALREMTPPDNNETLWIDEALENHMAKVMPTILDLSQSDERAALRTHLMQRVETIYLYRECARVKLRHHDALPFIPLQEAVDIEHPEQAYPLPQKAADAPTNSLGGFTMS
jgi:DNA invertase Pin-like site-specific DNA recombinase